MKYIKVFSVFFFLFLSTGCFSDNDQEFNLAFDYIRGEVFVRLANGFDREDLEAIVSDFEVTINRELGTGYVIDVPADFEPLWITQFSSVPIIVESTYNRYGYNYTIELEDPAPVVEDNELTITVNYSGCEGGHLFSLERPGAFSNNMIVWLFKSTPDEDCEMAISEEYTFSIERFIQVATQVTIEDPYGNQVQLWPDPEEPVSD